MTLGYSPRCSGAAMFETFEHTADLGLRVEAADLNGLFAEAGRGLTSMLVDDPEQIRPMQELRLHVDGGDRAYLLFDWLNELLYRFESERLLFRDFQVHVSESGIDATLRGEPADPDRHQLAHEVKAITYHQLVIEPTESGWRAEVIVDI